MQKGNRLRWFSLLCALLLLAAVAFAGCAAESGEDGGGAPQDPPGQQTVPEETPGKDEEEAAEKAVYAQIEGQVSAEGGFTSCGSRGWTRCSIVNVRTDKNTRAGTSYLTKNSKWPLSPR